MCKRCWFGILSSRNSFRSKTFGNIYPRLEGGEGIAKSAQIHVFEDYSTGHTFFLSESKNAIGQQGRWEFENFYISSKETANKKNDPRFRRTRRAPFSFRNWKIEKLNFSLYVHISIGISNEDIVESKERKENIGS